MRLRIVLQVLVAAAIFGATLAASVPYSSFGGSSDDLATAIRQSLFGPRSLEGGKVVVIALDRRSVDDPRLAATPRALMSPIWAEIAQKAFDHGAEKVALDFILAFDGGDLQVGDERPLRQYDTPFLRLLRSEGRAGRLIIGRSQELIPARRFSATSGAPGVAFVEIDADVDGVVRRARTRFATKDGETAATLSGALLGPDAPEEIALTPPAPFTTLPTATVVDVLACDDDAALSRLFGGRMVLIGGTLPGEDRFRAPDRFMDEPAEPETAAAGDGPCAFASIPVRGSDGNLPGVFLHAAAVDAELSGWALKPASSLVIAVAAAAGAAIAGLAGLALSPWAAAAIAVTVGAVGFAAGVGAQEAGYLFPSARVAFAALVGFTAGWAGRLLFLDRRSRALRASFGRYVAPELVERILAQERLPVLDGETRDVTIMFADLSGFTALSERLKDGKKLTAVVNKYLSIVAREVEASGGYVDKFIGDAVMAIWNAPADHPDHERAAAHAAVRIRDRVDEEAAKDEAEGLPHFSIKIGLNSGEAVVGNVGDENRLNYTAVGDTVNIAARMEGLPSVFKTPIVMGAGCARAAGEAFAMLEIASIKVKGKTEPVSLFAPFPTAARAQFAAYGEALAAYRDRAFDEAARRWRELAGVEWPGAPVAKVMADLALAAKEEALPDDWDGAVVMTTK